MFIPSFGLFFLIRFLVTMTKYTVLDEQWREAKERKSQHQNPRSITSGAMLDTEMSNLSLRSLYPCHMDKF